MGKKREKLTPDKLTYNENGKPVDKNGNILREPSGKIQRPHTPNPVGAQLDNQNRLKYCEEKLTTSWDYFENYKDYGDEIPMIEGLALVLKVDKSTLYDWAQHPDRVEFGQVMRLIKLQQHNDLVNGGLSGKNNAAMTRLLLGNNHGYSEKQEIKQDTTATVKHEISSVDKFANILNEYKTD